jgi:hypothetical protein
MGLKLLEIPRYHKTRSRFLIGFLLQWSHTILVEQAPKNMTENIVSSPSLNSLLRVIEEQQERIDQLEEKKQEHELKIEELSWWADKNNFFRPESIENQSGLPLPRLEIELIAHSSYEHEWKYSLVYQHLNGNIVKTPLGQTYSRGSHTGFPYKSEDQEQVELALPFRMGQDIKFDGRNFKMPCYAIFEGKNYPLAWRE